METTDIRKIWKAHDNLLDRSMKLNIMCIEMIQSQKSKSKLRPLLFLRIFEAAVSILIIGFLCSLADDLLPDKKSIFILLSMVILFSVYTLYLCIRQIIIILQINFMSSVTEIQKKLTLLQTHVLDYFRLSFLVIPFWFIYPWLGLKLLAGDDILNSLPESWWTWNIVISLIFSALSIYAYTQVTYKNIHKRWVRFFIKNAGGESVTKSMEFLKVIDDFKKN